jgi:hypothetical protein
MFMSLLVHARKSSRPGSGPIEVFVSAFDSGVQRIALRSHKHTLISILWHVIGTPSVWLFSFPQHACAPHVLRVLSPTSTAVDAFNDPVLPAHIFYLKLSIKSLKAPSHGQDSRSDYHATAFKMHIQAGSL